MNKKTMKSEKISQENDNLDQEIATAIAGMVKPAIMTKDYQNQLYKIPVEAPKHSFIQELLEKEITIPLAPFSAVAVACTIATLMFFHTLLMPVEIQQQNYELENFYEPIASIENYHRLP